MVMGMSDAEYCAKLQEEHDRLLVEVERLRLVERRCSPSVVCECPEFCQYHARSNFEAMKLENKKLLTVLEEIAKADHDFSVCHDQYGKFTGCKCAKGLAQKVVDRVSKNRSNKTGEV